MIEAMIVVAIIAILALMAIPNYTNKIIRDQIKEALPLADVAKPKAAAAWALTQTLPTDNASAGLPAADKIVNNLVSATTVDGGAIHLTFGNRAHGLIKGKTLTVRPAVVEGEPVVPITWVCGNAKAPDKMTLKGTNKTDVPTTYLPFACMGT